VGEVCSDYQVASLKAAALRLLAHLETDASVPARCRELGARLFSPQAAVQQIAAAFQACQQR